MWLDQGSDNEEMTQTESIMIKTETKYQRAEYLQGGKHLKRGKKIGCQDQLRHEITRYILTKQQTRRKNLVS